jgi:hypothetical protein
MPPRSSLGGICSHVLRGYKLLFAPGADIIPPSSPDQVQPRVVVGETLSLLSGLGQLLAGQLAASLLPLLPRLPLRHYCFTAHTTAAT